MELSYLGKDVFGEHESRVIFALGRVHKQMSGRQIARVTDVPKTTVQRILNHYEKIGLVELEQQGRTYLYSLNRKHVLWAAFEIVFSARESLLEYMKKKYEALAAEYDASVTLFGSVARFESSIDSDIDIFLVVPAKTEIDDSLREEILNKTSKIEEKVFKRSGNTLNTLTITTTDVKRMKKSSDALLANVLNEGKHVAGEALPELVKKLR